MDVADHFNETIFFVFFEKEIQVYGQSADVFVVL